MNVYTLKRKRALPTSKAKRKKKCENLQSHEVGRREKYLIYKHSKHNYCDISVIKLLDEFFSTRAVQQKISLRIFKTRNSESTIFILDLADNENNSLIREFLHDPRLPFFMQKNRISGLHFANTRSKVPVFVPTLEDIILIQNKLSFLKSLRFFACNLSLLLQYHSINLRYLSCGNIFGKIRVEKLSSLSRLESLHINSSLANFDVVKLNRSSLLHLSIDHIKEDDHVWPLCSDLTSLKSIYLQIDGTNNLIFLPTLNIKGNYYRINEKLYPLIIHYDPDDPVNSLSLVKTDFNHDCTHNIIPGSIEYLKITYHFLPNGLEHFLFVLHTLKIYSNLKLKVLDISECHFPSSSVEDYLKVLFCHNFNFKIRPNFSQIDPVLKTSGLKDNYQNLLTRDNCEVNKWMNSKHFQLQKEIIIIFLMCMNKRNKEVPYLISQMMLNYLTQHKFYNSDLDYYQSLNRIYQ